MDAFRACFPKLRELLQETTFEADATAAASCADSKADMKAALQGRVFASNELMWLLCGAVVPEWANSEAVQLERDLGAIVGTVGMAATRTAYKDKFLVEAKSKIQDAQTKALDAKNKLEDVRYEIAVTAKACAVLDVGSILLESPIPDPNKKEKDWKNSDVFGTFHGQPVRIEVTVLHESLLPAIHIELDDFVKQAEIASGFRITLRSMLVDEGYAERVRALVELLHERHVASNGEDVEIDGVCFEWKQRAYHCPQVNSPFETICFYRADEVAEAETVREIIHPCSVRPVTPEYILEDNPNRPGVITSADLPNAPTQVPVSTKVSQMLGAKLQQCEEGIINIVAFGNPLPMHDREVVNAVLGAEFVSVPLPTDKHGVRHSGRGVLQRAPKAPFVPKHCLAIEDRIQFTEPFTNLSAVWHIRLGWYAKSQILPNPNASHPIPRELVQAWSDPPPPPKPKATAEQPDPGKAADSDRAEVSEQEEEIVWAEVAKNYVDDCGSLSEARSVLTQLEQAGLSIDELRKKVEQVWSEPQEKETKFISPTNEDMAMTFVVDCGGYEQASACLDAYSEEIEDSFSQNN